MTCVPINISCCCCGLYYFIDAIIGHSLEPWVSTRAGQGRCRPRLAEGLTHVIMLLSHPLSSPALKKVGPGQDRVLVSGQGDQGHEVHSIVTTCQSDVAVSALRYVNQISQQRQRVGLGSSD